MGLNCVVNYWVVWFCFAFKSDFIAVLFFINIWIVSQNCFYDSITTISIFGILQNLDINIYQLFNPVWFSDYIYLLNLYLIPEFFKNYETHIYWSWEYSGNFKIILGIFGINFTCMLIRSTDKSGYKLRFKNYFKITKIMFL